MGAIKTLRAEIDPCSYEYDDWLRTRFPPVDVYNWLEDGAQGPRRGGRWGARHTRRSARPVAQAPRRPRSGNWGQEGCVFGPQGD